MTHNTTLPIMKNTTHPVKFLFAQVNNAAVKKSAGVSKELLQDNAKNVSVQRRYSFDDNGGGYLGL